MSLIWINLFGAGGCGSSPLGAATDSYGLFIPLSRYRGRRGRSKSRLAVLLRQLIDLSINQTLGRTVATSLTVLLSILPLAVAGGEIMRGFAEAIIFGIIIGTSSSIFTASPILLFRGEKRSRSGLAQAAPRNRVAGRKFAAFADAFSRRTRNRRR
jgi:hypothetical protein